MLYTQPVTFPGRSPAGRAQIHGQRATRANGPFAPCPVNASDGRQVPCDLPHRSLYSGSAPAPPPGFVQPDPIRFHLTNINLDALVSIGDNDFTMRVTYDIAWSDRFAVHPCKIWLWSGVPEGGKKVNASRWWVPNPAKGRTKNLKVGHEVRARARLHVRVPT